VLLGALAPACTSEAVEMWPAAPAHWQTDTRPARSSNPLTPTDKERALADAYATALASPAFAGLGAMLTEEVHLALGNANTHGRERVLKQLEDTFGAFDQRRFATSRLWLTDSTHPLDSQAFEWTMTGVHAREWMGIAATLKPVVIKGLTLLWTDDDGIVSEVHVYFDEEVVRAQLGSGPAELQKLQTPPTGAGARQVFERGGAPEEVANVATVRSTLQALEDNREADFLSHMADEIDVFTLDSAQPAHGKDAARAYFEAMRRSVQALDTVVRNAWGVQSFVVFEYVITGLQVGPLPRLAFTASHPLHSRYADVIELRGGQIARIWRYADPAPSGTAPSASTAARPDSAPRPLGATPLKGPDR
jgi:ketosteroid isomerase-like protein